jgi:hypothetical protein
VDEERAMLKMNDGIRSLIVAAQSLVDGQHPASPDDVPAQVAAEATRQVAPLLQPAREGEAEWDALNELSNAVRLAVAARVRGSAESDARMKNLSVTIKHAQDVLDGIATIPA